MVPLSLGVRWVSCLLTTTSFIYCYTHVCVCVSFRVQTCFGECLPSMPSHGLLRCATHCGVLFQCTRARVARGRGTPSSRAGRALGPQRPTFAPSGVRCARHVGKLDQAQVGSDAFRRCSAPFTCDGCKKQLPKRRSDEVCGVYAACSYNKHRVCSYCVCNLHKI